MEIDNVETGQLVGDTIVGFFEVVPILFGCFILSIVAACGGALVGVGSLVLLVVK